MSEALKKFCFYICPIGSAGSEIRKDSDGNMREVIIPVCEEAGYHVARADHDRTPGMVTDAIVTKLIEADLVIADLRGHNPNVMYEVAIRHATDKPIIQMIPEGEKLPFDIGGLNTIQYDDSIEGLERWRGHLREALGAVDRGDAGYNPVSRAAVFRGLQAQDIDGSDALTMILHRLGSLEQMIGRQGFADTSDWDAVPAGSVVANIINPPPGELRSSNQTLMFTIQGQAFATNGLAAATLEVRDGGQGYAGELWPVGDGPGRVEQNRFDVTATATGFALDVRFQNPEEVGTTIICFRLHAIENGPTPSTDITEAWTTIHWSPSRVPPA